MRSIAGILAGLVAMSALPPAVAAMTRGSGGGTVEVTMGQPSE
jgi:hypothetical protein